MKVLQINKLYTPWIGGVETHVQQLSEGLEQAGVKVEVICCNTSWRSQRDCINGVPVFRSGSFGMAFSMPIAPLFPVDLRKHPADILHFHFPNPKADLSYWIARPKGKIVVTWHSDIVKQKRFLAVYRKPLMAFLHKADRIIATSPNMANNAIFLQPFHQKISVIPLSINPKKYEKNLCIQKKVNKIKLENGRFLLFVGRFVYYKGADILLQALRGTSVKAIFIGEGPIKSACEAEAKRRLSPDQAIFLPPQSFETLLAYFHACEFLVLPSVATSEAFGIVQLEAMVSEKPVISTNLPTGVPYVNQHGQTGLVVPPMDVLALNTAIQTLWHDPLLCKQMGLQAKKRVLTEFSEEKMLSRMMNLYDFLAADTAIATNTIPNIP